MAVAIVGTALVIASCGGAAEERPYVLATNLAQVFEAEGVDGTIVIKDLEADEPPLIYNLERSRLAFPPAETFRPLANLVLLHTETVASLDSVLTWNGEGPYVQDWDREHSIRSASVAGVHAEWLYVQTLADLGRDPVGVWVQRVGYGNQNVGTRDGQSFWMNGTLLITTGQQVEFIELIFSERHPFDHYSALDTKDLFRVESGTDWMLRYVLGRVPGPRTADKVGWLVGVLETDEGSVAVAMNTDIHWDRTIDPDKRVRIAVAALDEAGLLEP